MRMWQWLSLGVATVVVMAAAEGCARAFWAPASAEAATLTARGTAASADDAVKRALLGTKTIYEIRERLQKLGGRLSTHIVANRGHENPEGGSFSFFETYAGPVPGGVVKEGELFIGFFSEREGDTLQVMQSFEPGLMVELIAWDATKGMYNFWELVGTGQGSQWHYRGDSADVLADVARINTGEATPVFGTRLRCSGCHTLGGPILKELAAPQNDWWTEAHRLELGSMKLGGESQAAKTASALFARATDASHLSRLVKGGIDRLVAERARRGDGQGLKRQLRSLFGTMEMNLVSDERPYTERAGGAIAVPQDFFVDRRLVGTQAAVSVPQADYAQALTAAGSRFAPDEANRPETRHAFVVPARSHMDNAVIEALMAKGLLDAELVADVLAVDLTTPVYSPARASLLRYVPEQAGSVSALRAQLIANLQQAPAGDAAARELLTNLIDPARTAAAHRQRAIAYLKACREASHSSKTIFDWVSLAAQRRAELRAAQTSASPRGTITEPGFRVIFPEDRLQAQPFQRRLDERSCGCE